MTSVGQLKAAAPDRRAEMIQTVTPVNAARLAQLALFGAKAVSDRMQDPYRRRDLDVAELEAYLEVAAGLVKQSLSGDPEPTGGERMLGLRLTDAMHRELGLLGEPILEFHADADRTHVTTISRAKTRTAWVHEWEADPMGHGQARLVRAVRFEQWAEGADR